MKPAEVRLIHAHGLASSHETTIDEQFRKTGLKI
jgi:hypothetical protein